MSVYDALSLVFQFASLMVAVLALVVTLVLALRRK
ncbi:putative holin-like toxin [Alicyclobacillus acidocaldarius]|uniref:Holin-like toxin n=1 Tax=Alicyclobacillus acidocaldarius subsp. acidocaldarius (strain ATCC 27009 / DSM 446 / BCRC 14685 / JCM 5260 / KCTC 1825 / NBRC 15652 / NCIMB 11725 / NRRL B-14509 / 104-IA) TaxID=521098 RepID=C8WYF3_ALIAD|nr:putative holin-like toxin [Alicyclobacillus acidocaldarius]ACV60047.1 hypothetical protein Aaci_3044 [Alicyclobacillus acidocaldarius subsp. acidocaldarius DSM 446]